MGQLVDIRQRTTSCACTIAGAARAPAADKPATLAKNFLRSNVSLPDILLRACALRLYMLRILNIYSVVVEVRQGKGSGQMKRTGVMGSVQPVCRGKRQLRDAGRKCPCDTRGKNVMTRTRVTAL
ncbi:hypothetical protein [Paracoccus luteus]|uniref:hypothetical protein n=1 Tax=Paracoccus luteus TaxID=2508543 RepID=UPI001C6FE934|nr:hypothetical protein [Paracoccus luteus]